MGMMRTDYLVKEFGMSDLSGATTPHAERAYALSLIEKPATTAAEAERLVRAMVAGGIAYHYEDDPAQILEGTSDRPLFTPAQVELVRKRARELLNLPDFDPFALLVFLTNSPDELLALDAELIRRFGEGLNAEQMDCLRLGTRREEAVAMLDDMEARMGISAEVVGAIRQLWRHEQEVPGHG